MSDVNQFHNDKKFVFLGHRGVGKTSLIMRYTEKTFVDNYYPTIEDVHDKIVDLSGTKYKFTILDTSGQDEFSMLNSHHTIGTDVFVLVFSVASKKSFEMVNSIKDKILDQTGLDHVPMLLVGCKSDLENMRQVPKEDAQNLASSLNCQYIECSAKDEVNIDKVFEMSLKEILGHDISLSSNKSDSKSGSA
ncbi:hypothetical protein BB560_006006, partial [Smittium megazygosporum]